MRKTWPLSLLLAVPLCLANSGCPMQDSDGDGVPDVIDQCPTVPGPWDNLGCPLPVEAPYDCANPPALAGFVPVKSPLPDQFLVVLKPGTVAGPAASAVTSLAAKYGLKDVVPLKLGFAAKIQAGLQLKQGQKVPSAVQAGAIVLARLIREPSVAYVAQVGTRHLVWSPPVLAGNSPRLSTPMPFVGTRGFKALQSLPTSSFRIADPTEAATSGSASSREGMSASATHDGGPMVADMSAGVGRFQMGGVHARTIPTTMMKSLIGMDWRDELGVGVAVGSDGDSISVKPAISAAVFPSGPKPAAATADSVGGLEVHTVSIPWNLDRVDQRDRPGDGKFEPAGDGSGVHIIVNDTGVTRTADLGSRLSDQCYSTIVLRGCEDGHGHGTHVSGTAAGTTWGVAKQATVHSDRFLDEQGSGSDTDAILTIEKAVEWANADKAVRWVLNASWGGSPTPTIDAAVCKAIDAGIVFVAAAGNESASSYSSTPARVLQVITAGAMDSSDHYADFSNYGPGVDLFAPGVDIESDTPAGGTTTMSGTSMATPHVVGAAALYLQAHPAAPPAEVSAALVAAASKDKLSGLPADTPNLLLFVGKEGGSGTPGKALP